MDNTFFGIMALLVSFLVVILVVDYGMTKNEQVECYRWQSEATSRPGYYLLGWQKAQCDEHGVTINAEVK